jgi:hypothetical protein
MKPSYLNHIIDLIEEALACLDRLGRQYELELAPAFVESMNALQTPSVVPSQQLLLLSAVRRRIKTAERTVVDGLINGQPVVSTKMSDLVRVRLVCTELLNTLNEANLTLKNKR